MRVLWLLALLLALVACAAAQRRTSSSSRSSSSNSGSSRSSSSSFSRSSSSRSSSSTRRVTARPTARPIPRPTARPPPLPKPKPTTRKPSLSTRIKDGVKAVAGAVRGSGSTSAGSGSGSSGRVKTAIAAAAGLVKSSSSSGTSSTSGSGGTSGRIKTALAAAAAAGLVKSGTSSGTNTGGSATSGSGLTGAIKGLIKTASSSGTKPGDSSSSGSGLTGAIKGLIKSASSSGTKPGDSSSSGSGTSGIKSAAAALLAAVKKRKTTTRRPFFGRSTRRPSFGGEEPFFERPLRCRRIPAGACAVAFDESDCDGGWDLDIAEGRQSFSGVYRDDVETFGVRSGCVLTAFADDDFSGPQVTIRGGPFGSGQPNWVVLKDEFGYQHMHEAVGSVTCQCTRGAPRSEKPPRCRRIPAGACAVAFDESDCDGGWDLDIAEGRQSFSRVYRDDVETFGVRSGCVLTAFADDDFSGPQVTIRGGQLGSGQPNWVVLKNEPGYEHMHEAVGSVSCQCETISRPPTRPPPPRPLPTTRPPSDKPRRCRQVSQSACAVAFDESNCDGGWDLDIAEGEQHFSRNPFSSSYSYRNDMETVGVKAGCVLTLFNGNRWTGDQVTVRGGDRWPKWVVLKDTPGYKDFHESVASIRCSC